MALNTYESGGSGHLWLWMPMKVVALDAYPKWGGSEKLNWKKNGFKCLNEKMAFNAHETDGSKHL